MSEIPEKWIHTWNLFDEKRTGYVSQTDFKHIVRALGKKYTEAEFRDHMKDMPDPIKFDNFVQFMHKPYIGPTEEDLKVALQTFDTSDSGVLKISELTTMLTTLGERMSEEDVKQLLSEVKVDGNGCVSIEDFTNFLCAPVPSLTTNIAELQKQLEEAEKF